MRALASWGVGRGKYGVQQLFISDSRVVVGAARHGRSPSRTLNGVLRALVPYLLLGRIRPRFLWVDSKSNLADGPSRGFDVPPPEAQPAWLTRVMRSSSEEEEKERRRLSCALSRGGWNEKQ